MLYSIKKWEKIWSEKGKCINFATAKRGGHGAAVRERKSSLKELKKQV